jgi:ribonuclease J
VGLPRVGLYVPLTQRIKIRELAEFERVDRHRALRVFPEDLRERRGQLVLTFRPSMATELERAGCLEGARLVWSMWPGYLLDDRMAWFHDFLRRYRIEVTVAHASGHATSADLQRLAEAADPESVVPIHTGAPERFPRLFRNVTPHADGEWWEV